VLLQSMRIDRFGTCRDLNLDGLSDGIQVLYGPTGSGKGTILQFLRAILFGFDRTTRQDYLPVDSRGFGGTITVDTDHGVQAVSRYDDGGSDGRLTVEHEDGRVIGHRQLATLLSGLTTEPFDNIFAVDFSTRPQVDCLVANMKAAGVSLEPRGESADLIELRERLGRHQREFKSLSTSPRSIEALHRRCRELVDEIAAIESLVASARTDFDRERLVERRDRTERQLSEDRSGAKRVEGSISQLQLRRDEARRRRAGIRESLTADDVQRRHAPELQEIDREIERWRRTVTEIDARKRKLQSEMGYEDPTVHGSADPRRPLADLEQRIHQLESRIAGLEHHNDISLGQQLRAELRTTLTQMLTELYSVCGELSRWESASESYSQANELHQLSRCESELKRVIETLLAKRRARVGCDSSRHDKWCQCNGHPNAKMAGIARPVETESTAQLDSDIAQLEDQQDRLRGQIKALEVELVELDRHHADLPFEGEKQLLDRLHAHRVELDRAQDEIRATERRRAIAETIAELQLEIHSLEGRKVGSSIVTDASLILREISGGAFQGLEFDASERIAVFDQAGRGFNWPQLDEGGRDQTYLSILLAIQADLATNGYRLPLVLSEVFTNLDDRDIRAAAEILRDASIHRQVLILTRHHHVADVFRDLGASVRSIGDHDVEASRTDRAPRFDRAEQRQQVHWDRLESDDHEYNLTEDSPIEDAPSLNAGDIACFRSHGVRTVGHLLDISPLEVTTEFRSISATEQQVRAWQAQALLMCRVPHLRAYDARILVACDVTDSDQLRSISPQRLREIVQRFASSSNGQSLLLSGTEFELSRVTDWMHTDRNGSDAEDDGLLDYGDARSRSRNGPSSGERRSRSRRSQVSSRSDEGNRGARRRTDREGREREPDSSRKKKRGVVKMRESAQMRFFLNAADPVVDAPSIGPRTAQRLADIGIQSVHDLLEADAEQLAERLGQKRITSETIVQWQQQTTLAIRVPQLRGHDAQILVALGVTSPERLAEMNPDDLWAEVAPFVRSNQGKRIIRNGRQPDLQEATDWVTWASSARSLQAA
jgi:energy-coupling factor transporter ATP-binding protein EcfA2